ncbi:hypothetical protein PAL_GLEAN10011766 [Pteropus alecto]|uniref:Uncharacterized protein n=1 Tax=Pteropus alecto TaxID=9402 RepID=L5KJY6_PTEAL|nr:hypothetical protein PAL_GLEAN10011766 [Pteropus alecto]
MGAAALIAGAMGPGNDTVFNESVIWISDNETGVDTSFRNSILLVEIAALCHCNAHSKGRYWKEQHSLSLASILVTFNSQFLEINRDLQHESRTGAPEGVCHHTVGTLKEITLQENPSSALQDAGSPNFLKLAVPVLVYRNQDPALTLPHLRKIMRHLQQTLLLHDFFQNLHEELTCFFQSVLLSLHCFSFTNGSILMGNDLHRTDQWVVGAQVKHCVIMKQALQVPYRNLSLYGDMVLHAADGILQEPKVHTRPLLPSELFYSMVSLCRVSLLPPPAPPPSLPVAQFAFTPPFFTDMAHDSGVLRLDVPRKWLGCCPDYMSSHQLGLEACLPPSACCSWRFLADGAAGHRPGLWSKAGGRV